MLRQLHRSPVTSSPLTEPSFPSFALHRWIEAGTDKGTVSGDAQGYTLVYEMLFAPMRDRPINLLEIGLAIGGPEHDQPASRTAVDASDARRRHYCLGFGRSRAIV
jgi:hypothetical protein